MYLVHIKRQPKNCIDCGTSFISDSLRCAPCIKLWHKTTYAAWHAKNWKDHSQKASEWYRDNKYKARLLNLKYKKLREAKAIVAGTWQVCCVDCFTPIKPSNRFKRCSECQPKYRKIYKRKLTRDYYARHREQRKAAATKWRQDHPEQWHIILRKAQVKQALKRKVMRATITA